MTTDRRALLEEYDRLLAEAPHQGGVPDEIFDRLATAFGDACDGDLRRKPQNHAARAAAPRFGQHSRASENNARRQRKRLGLDQEDA